ncbi:MAG: galactokinase [Treponema sp.]|nr:galactokinase [Treponema sp.]
MNARKMQEGMLESLYGPDAVPREQRRYAGLIEGLGDDIRIFSAPGRTELGGNHTDHNRGRVLAAAIQMDAVAAVVPRPDGKVFFRSTGFPDVQVDLSGKDALAPRPQEQGTTGALVRGIAAEFARRGIQPGGFNANASSTVLPGSGLSSSAAVEVLLAKIFDALYGGGRCSPLELARISQKAENDFFGKPSGLMDQAASACGGAVAIDFADPDAPALTPVNFDPLSAGFALCVVNTRGSHADLTPDYAAIPREMNAVARFFGKSFLREIELSQLLAHAGELRKAVGDRALLRAIHFCNENRRAQAMAETKQMGRFLELVNESGDSSWELLQNLYPPGDPCQQGLPLALAVTREFFREQGLEAPTAAACRVHGGGFAGTIQAYIPVAAFDAYRARMEALFGPGAVTTLRIRPVGAVELEK